MMAAPPTAKTTLSAMRPDDRRTRNGEPVARPIANPTIGPINGATSIAPMTTAALPTTRPSVAIPTETTSCNQYVVASLASRFSMVATNGERAVGELPSSRSSLSWVRTMAKGVKLATGADGRRSGGGRAHEFAGQALLGGAASARFETAASPSGGGAWGR